MYQLEILAIEHIRDLRREADQDRLAASARTAAPATPKRIAAGTLIWAGQRLTYWGNQLQREYQKPAFN